MKSEPLPLRFERHYIPEPNSGCWLWTGAVNLDGYGWIGKGAPSRSVLSAHRVSWELHRGEIPSGLRVLHRCDMPCCVNPEHLFLGTQKDNVVDCKAKDRLNRSRGTSQHLAKLTEQQVREIRASELTLRELAAIYKVNISTLSALRRHHTWKHVA